MNGFDVEAVLSQHRPLTIYSAPHECVCLCDRGPRGQRYRDKTHRAHVAAVLRVEIDRALGGAWDEGWERCADLVQDGGTFKDYYDNPYRPTLAATEGD